MRMPIDWLLNADPWVVYRARVDLLGESESSAQVQSARKAMLTYPLVQGLIRELQGWPGEVLASHKSAGQLFHKLAFAADLGLKAHNSGIDVVIARVLEHQAEEGPFQLPTKISAAHGGTGQETWAWALCDAPITVYALARMGLAEDERVRRAIHYVEGMVRENDWPCAVSKELGSFRGPGRKQNPCPFATLAMLKALSAFNNLRDNPASPLAWRCC